MFAGCLADQPGGQGAGVGEGLVVEVDGGVEAFPAGSGRTSNSVWSVPQCRATAAAAGRSSNRASSKPAVNVRTPCLAGGFGQQSDDDGRVDPPAQEHPEGDIRDEPCPHSTPHGLSEKLPLSNTLPCCRSP